MLALLLSLFAVASEEDEAIARFKKEYSTPKVEDRAAAVKSLGATKGEKILKVLADLLGRDEAAVRIEAADALGGFDGYATKASAYLLASLGGNREETVQAALLEAVGRLKEESSAPVVNKWIDVKDNRVAKAAVEATGLIRSASSIEPLIDLLKKLEKLGRLSKSSANQAGGPSIPGSARNDSNKEARERMKALQPPTIKALQSITKQGLKVPEDWDEWWKKNRATFKVEK